MNALRTILYEQGHVFPNGILHLKRIKALLDDLDNGLAPIGLKECLCLVEQIQKQTVRIDGKTNKIKALSEKTDILRRLQTMLGVGPLTALAIEAVAPSMESIKSVRDFAAWLGIVPRQHSPGGKGRLGKVSKAGQADIRQLLIIGAMTRLNWLGRQNVQPGSWLSRMMERKPKMLVAVALANKMAQAIWAMLTKKQDYREPVQEAAAYQSC